MERRSEPKGLLKLFWNNHKIVSHVCGLHEVYKMTLKQAANFVGPCFSIYKVLVPLFKGITYDSMR